MSVESWFAMQGIDPAVTRMNYANLKRLKIEELKDMSEVHIWKESVIEASRDLCKLIRYILGKRNWEIGK